MKGSAQNRMNLSDGRGGQRLAVLATLIAQLGVEAVQLR
jgi:hypothetical protein